jgi:hypothetical protein
LAKKRSFEMSRLSGFLISVILAGTLLASTASAGPNGNTNGDPDIPNAGLTMGHLDLNPEWKVTSARVDVDRSVHMERKMGWSSVIRWFMQWARIAAR